MYPEDEEALPICTTCGTQYSACFEPTAGTASCFICADPRQYVPSSGSTYTTHLELRKNHCNEIKPLEGVESIWQITTVPKFAIGQRCFLIKTPHGNVLWDLISLCDEQTVKFIRSQGGLKAIVISHPHYYTTHLLWSRLFDDVKVYTAVQDKLWNARLSEGSARGVCSTLSSPSHQFQIIPGVTAVNVGGHFHGSLCLLVDMRLFVADTLVTVPGSKGPWEEPPKGVASYAFMWSIPNMIPLGPEEMKEMWRRLRVLDFASTHGAFEGMDVVGKNVRERVRQSVLIALGAMAVEWDAEY